ncbi:ATP-binding protein [Rhodococcus sp. NPDC056743]|uniref:ATP-binding protein n=1 Tax=Rhodococcus sp. NPDC056743 TaxID=3345934 RepID=UPI00366EF378
MGHDPPALEGRNDQIDAFDLLVARSKRRNYDRGMILSGLRGVGKTSLLNYLAHHADSQGWLTISIEGRTADETEPGAVRAERLVTLTGRIHSGDDHH